ncbi:MAG: lysoplasmalogenase [Bacteroidales bacterium]|nr:lysoplasmalogenase [Bacteroidales bacterium]MCF8405891.1 lysoplasmalogenase [Bacteroidales bacterium]
MKQSIFTVLFFAIGILFIFMEMFGSPTFFYLALGVKALIMPTLMIYYHTEVRGRYTVYHRLMMIGFFFSWLGDVLLQFSNSGMELFFKAETFFLFGLAAFLFTQIFYTIAFNIPKGKNKIFTTRIYQLILILIYGFLLLWLLYNKLGDYKIPVIVYAIVIHLMLASALNRHGKVNGVSYMLVAIGAILFIASDSMIAINRFLEKFDFARILIMSTYILAQYLISIGSLRQDCENLHE